MTVPERYWRHPTRAAIDSLAKRFSLPNEPHMQDWEYDVADLVRLPEFLEALERDELTDDERFTLSKTVMQCFDDLAASGVQVDQTRDWKRFVVLLDDAFYISPLVRQLWAEVEPALREP